jgi:Arc/MetJ-type ribon-helix-helix transcriptional regulator
MAIELPQDLEERTRALAASGEYGGTPADVVQAGLDELEARAETEHDWTDYLRFRFEQGRAAIARGEYGDSAPAELTARIRTRVEQNA